MVATGFFLPKMKKLSLILPKIPISGNLPKLDPAAKSGFFLPKMVPHAPIFEKNLIFLISPGARRVCAAERGAPPVFKMKKVNFLFF